ncbi:MAG: HAD-IC family P-type ATPase, partial [Candidatus Colwellbacteria bacterium]|nr:HAD-IC family P-type ATPase [Candidatus Colwellbacteria bacterium]
MPDSWYAKTITVALELLNSTGQGLSQEEAKSRLVSYGPNRLPRAKREGYPLIFLRQFQSPLIYILFIAGAVVYLVGNTVDALVILAVLLFNAVAGTIQEGKAQNTLLVLEKFIKTPATAQNTLLVLEKFIKTPATVLRDGKETILSDEEVVPGDIILLQEGEKVPADARLIVANHLTLDESAFTGESLPINKTADVLKNTDSALPTAEQKNMVFKGTNVVAGNGKAVAVSTGLDTVIGRISREVARIDTDIPLKADIKHLSRLIILTVFGLGTVLYSLGLYFGKGVKEMFVTIVALSVSIIPEGLPIVMTLVLATGVWRMSRRNVLIKRLQAVEALGQAEIIAVDKTGTITKNELVVKKVYIDGKFFEVTGSGYEPRGEVKLARETVEPLTHPEVLFAGRIAAFCSNARISFIEGERTWRISGDPTEAALLALAQKIGFHKDKLEEESPLTFELPFDYKTKYHLTIHKVNGKDFVTVVGAPEKVLKVSSKVWEKERATPLTTSKREELEAVFSSMSKEGLRVLGFAVLNDRVSPPVEKNLKNMTFVGFYGIEDTLRPEVKEAMRLVRAAGMKVVMITGDYRLTAIAIAKEAGIYKDKDTVLTGEELADLTPDELAKKLPSISVFARVTPEDKLKIIEAYKKRGEIVAMTGDGVNDAPPLVAADLGVAMGGIGTEVAKEASDLVLLDDNFGSIISAVEEGRNIYKTIKRVILYLFSTSVGEVFTITGALLMGYPLPILPTQIIWLNFVTDGFLDVALAMEPKEKGLLRKKFRRGKYLIDSLMTQRIFVMAIPMTLGTLFLFTSFLNGNFSSDLTKALTISLTSLAVFQWFNAWNCRSEE